MAEIPTPATRAGDVEADASASVAMPRWLPNAISILRIALVPAWLVLAHHHRQASFSGDDRGPLGLIVILLLLGGSDVLDGYLARRFGLSTQVGAVLDAVADKLAQVAMVTFLTFYGTPAFTPLPLYLFAVVVGRDALMAAGFTIIKRSRGSVWAEHRVHGKVASVLLFLTVLWATSGFLPAAVSLLSALSATLIVASTAGYVRDGLTQVQSASPRGGARGTDRS